MFDRINNSLRMRNQIRNLDEWIAANALLQIILGFFLVVTLLIGTKAIAAASGLALVLLYLHLLLLTRLKAKALEMYIDDLQKQIRDALGVEELH